MNGIIFELEEKSKYTGRYMDGEISYNNTSIDYTKEIRECDRKSEIKDLLNDPFYVCKPLSFYKSQREIQKVNPLYAFKVATAYFREQGMIPVFEDANCKLIKL